MAPVKKKKLTFILHLTAIASMQCNKFVAWLWGTFEELFPRENHISRGKYDFLGEISSYFPSVQATDCLLYQITRDNLEYIGCYSFSIQVK